MTKLDQKPVIHGRDHLAGGADPIPGFLTGSGSVVYSDYIQSFSSLIGYWRLGEAASPFADSSGGGHDLTRQVHGVAMTPDVTGALPVGQDDGATKFNYTGTAANGGDWLATSSTASYFKLNPLTWAAFVNVHAYPGGSSRGEVAGSMGWAIGSPSVYSGWSFQVLSTGKIIASLGGEPGVSEKYAQSPGALVLDTWYLVAATYDGANIKLYLNGTLVATTAFSSGGLFGQTDGVHVGMLDISSSRLYFTGSVDELAVWNAALTADEIAGLYTAGVVTPTPGDGDQVFVSDGDGGSHWGQANGSAIEDGSIVDRHVATGANLDPLKLSHPGGTTSYLRADGTWATPSSSGSPSTDTQVWMPLTTTVGSDDVLVFDASHELIPTLTPI